VDILTEFYCTTIVSTFGPFNNLKIIPQSLLASTNWVGTCIVKIVCPQRWKGSSCPYQSNSVPHFNFLDATTDFLILVLIQAFISFH